MWNGFHLSSFFKRVDNTTSAWPFLGDDTVRSKGSLAYEYGWKVMSGAVKLMTGVTSGEKQVEDALQRLQTDLDHTRKNYALLEAQFNKAKVFLA